MIIETYCDYCRTAYEISWDDECDIYDKGVEDTDQDHTDYDSNELPEYCPFCGTHICFDED